jgi:hypothetical protein
LTGVAERSLRASSAAITLEEVPEFVRGRRSASTRLSAASDHPHPEVGVEEQGGTVRILINNRQRQSKALSYFGHRSQRAAGQAKGVTGTVGKFSRLVDDGAVAAITRARKALTFWRVGGPSVGRPARRARAGAAGWRR